MAETNLSAFIWSVADLLRGDYKQSDYGKVILPFTVLRRLDCVLEPSKAAVLEEKAVREGQGLDPEPFLLRKAGHNFCNTSPQDMKRLMGDGDNIAENLRSYIQGFSPAVRDIFDSFEFHLQVDRLDKANLLYLVTEKFGQIDLHPTTVSNAEMGLVFEELIRKFAELSNETAGEHFTPREVIRLMVNLIFIEDDEALTQPGIVRSLYDPTAGTGGMLSVAEEHLVSHNPSSRLVLSGQELNPESYAICKADMLIKGQDINSICFGNTLSDDQLPEEKYDYMLSNPPFGVEWKKIQKEVEAEHKALGFAGRFGPGLPRVSDGSLLFLLHLISKMRPAQDGGCRFGIVLNGSPLFTGGAGSGESEIRRYVLENDLLEAIIALPTDMFYNTGIATYVWIVSNRKPKARKGKVQLIDAGEFYEKMRKSLGSKRKQLSEAHIDDITRIFGKFKEVTRDGKPVSMKTAPVIWGSAGTNNQHAYFQMLHQGSDRIPVDFIAALKPQHELIDQQRALLANCFAQAEALMNGVQDPSLPPHRIFPGNRPSTMLLMDQLNPASLGALIALYEHKTFVLGALWDINSFDQWGVELGKTMALRILAELEGSESAGQHDSSTNALITRARSALK